MSKLKVTSKQRAVALDKTANRRKNLIGKIEEQKAMLATEVADKQYTVTKLVWITNEEQSIRRAKSSTQKQIMVDWAELYGGLSGKVFGVITQIYSTPH